MEFAVDYAKYMNPIKINNKEIPFVDSAKHVGMLRSSAGNHPTILARFKAHRQAVASVLHVGMARGHRGNPSASFRVHQLYGTPVLMSGLAPLVLTKHDVLLIEQHYKETSFQILYPRRSSRQWSLTTGNRNCEEKPQISHLFYILSLPSCHFQRPTHYGPQQAPHHQW